ncbi:hypothetical protein ACFL35_14915 [Candidatus Riflebacteria bacterium]
MINPPGNKLIFLFFVLYMMPDFVVVAQQNRHKPSNKFQTIKSGDENEIIKLNFPLDWKRKNITIDKNNIFAFKQLAPGRMFTFNLKQAILPGEISAGMLFKSTKNSYEIQKRVGNISKIVEIDVPGMEYSFFVTQSQSQARNHNNRFKSLFSYRKGLHIHLEMKIPILFFKKMEKEAETIIRSLKVKR